MGNDLVKSLKKLQLGASTATSSLTGLMKALEKTAQTGVKVSRSLASFDTLNRLSAVSTAKKELTELQQTVEELGAQVLKPLSIKSLDNMGGKVQAMTLNLREMANTYQQTNQVAKAMSQVVQWVFADLDTASQKTLGAKRTQEEFRTAVRNTAAELNTQTAALGAVTGAVGAVEQSFSRAAQGAQTAQQTVTQAWQNTGSWLQENVNTPVQTNFATLWQGVSTGAADAWSATKGVFSGAGDFFESTFSNAWAGVKRVFSNTGQVFTGIKDGVTTGFKTAVNVLIDGINNVVAEPFGNISTALLQLKGFKIGGKMPFADLKWNIYTPRIPHLAQGAVLPANKPFLAMVGDQRHGTNVEAPLETITQALRIALEDIQGQNQAGSQAAVDLLGRILEAVRGIHLSDSAIATAADRYYQKQAVLYGTGR